jgi:hypothetical protein
MLSYMILSTVVLGVLGIAWSRKTWPDMFVKVILLATALLGILHTLVLSGYLIHTR